MSKLAELRSKLDETRQRERRYATMALQKGISARHRMKFRQLALSARAEAKLREKALAHAEGRTT